MAFCYQQHFAMATRPVDSAQFWALVNAPQTQETIAAVRRLKRQGLTREADAAKRRLPAFIFQATFDETVSKKGYKGRWRKQAATRLTGLVVMDIDHVDEPRQKFDEWTLANGNIFGDEGILLVYVTPSGHGLKVVFRARTKWGNLIDNQHRMAERLGVEVDESCKDASRLSFICTKQDILFIDEEIFTYENQEFAEKYNAQYRGGSSQPTLFDAVDSTVDTGGTDGVAPHENAPAADASAEKGDRVAGAGDGLTYHGVSCEKIIDAWLDGKQPQPGDRHQTALKLASDLRYITDNDPAQIKRLLMGLPWVKAIVEERGEDIDRLVKNARDFKFYQSMPKRMGEVLKKAGVGDTEACGGDTAAAGTPLPLADWGEQIGQLADNYPCMRSIMHGVKTEGYPAALFVGAAFLGTDMTRCWYHFYHMPQKERRLNYSVIVIGDPSSGKSFATRLYQLLAAPLITADRVSNEAINRWKRERNERATSSKEQKKEALKKPDVIVRIHGTRTSNGVFIEDMNRAVDTVGQNEIHLHMLTFDAELDASTAASKGGQWIDKSNMELKAFHNEEDNQQYANSESVNGPFNVYWNYVYTGTPLSLTRKVTEHNFGSGLSTRLACIPFPSSDFKMLELRQQNRVDHTADEELKTWAFMLDSEARGELPLWPLVEQCWQWTAERMAIAEVNNDRADELLLKRVAYYGIAISTPFIVMRHWDEWKEKGTLTIDDTDHQLCELVMNIQYRCQHWFFGNYARAYFDNMSRDDAQRRTRSTRYKIAFDALPGEFGLDDVVRIFETKRGNARSIVSRLMKDKAIEAIDGKKGYKKLTLSI